LAGYAELHCHSYFSFLDGASSPEELVARASELGLPALALTDHDGLYGAMRFQRAALAAGIKPIFGAEVTLRDGAHLTLLAANRSGYANLCRLLSYAHLRQPKGKAALDPALLPEHSRGLICLSGCRQGPVARLLLRGARREARRALEFLAAAFPPGNLYVELQQLLGPGDDHLMRALAELAGELGLPVAATGNVHYATRAGSRLQDVLVCIRHNTTLAQAGTLLRPNSEAFLHSSAEMAALFGSCPEALRNTLEIAGRCELQLDFAAQAVPAQPLPPGRTPQERLRELCLQAFPGRYGHTGAERQKRALEQLEHELAVIEATGLSEYFLLVHDIVRHARQEGIRCQGRGSAANSIVAYLLGITAVDPLQHNLLFERFLSVERYSQEHSMPDIDLDCERDRREELIQYLYRRYGWEHTAMVCTLVTFRARSALRDAGKAMGFAPELLDRVAKSLDLHRASELTAEALSHILPSEELESPLWQELLRICRQMEGMPRHLGIHVGGMVITRCPLVEVVPLEPAAMPGRVVIQWDKDAAEDAGLIKIDILSLAMLSLIQEATQLVRSHYGQELELSSLPLDDPAVYDLICSGDTVGVFQVESRAQAQMLPRLQPRTFNDLVVEVALVRPGPLQGGMVHPYLRRRRGEEPVTYAHPAMEAALSDTLGVIVFQEQVLMVARDVAGFTPGEAEKLRRAMGRKRSREEMEALRERFVAGAMANGATRQQAEAVFDQLCAFASYGFNRAHAASFALLTYQSAWLKRYYPLAFYTALLNNQPMGFYGPDVVVGDAKRHGIRILPVDINRSQERCHIEGEAIRLGLRMVRGLGEASCRAILQARGSGGPFGSLRELCLRVPSLGRAALEALIIAGACDSWGVPRRELLWQLPRLLERPQPLIDDLPTVPLPQLSPKEALAWEQAQLGLTSAAEPAAFYQQALLRAGALPSSQLKEAPQGAWVRVGGEVIVRQRPPTARGFAFITLQDEEGFINLVLPPAVYGAHRLAVRAPGLLAEGVVERDGPLVNVRAERLWPLWPELS
jgi:error-prone DNA polymerase